MLAGPAGVSVTEPPKGILAKMQVHLRLGKCGVWLAIAAVVSLFSCGHDAGPKSVSAAGNSPANSAASPAAWTVMFPQSTSLNSSTIPTGTRRKIQCTNLVHAASPLWVTSSWSQFEPCKKDSASHRFSQFGQAEWTQLARGIRTRVATGLLDGSTSFER